MESLHVPPADGQAKAKVRIRMMDVLGKEKVRGKARKAKVVQQVANESPGGKPLDGSRPPTITCNSTVDGSIEATGIQICRRLTFTSFASAGHTGHHCTVCPHGSLVSSFILECLHRFMFPAMSYST